MNMAGTGERFFVQHLGQQSGPYTISELRQMVVAGSLNAQTTAARESDPGSYFPLGQSPGLYSHRTWMVTLVLSFLIGGLGVDRFYLGYTGLGIVKLLTCGGMGIWTIIDIILIAMKKLPDAEGLPLAEG